MSSLKKGVVQRQEDLMIIKNQINMIPLPQKVTLDNSKMNHAPSMETLLSKKLNDSTVKLSNKSNSRPTN